MADLMDMTLLRDDEREGFPDMSNDEIMDRHKHLTQACDVLFE